MVNYFFSNCGVDFDYNVLYGLLWIAPLILSNRFTNTPSNEMKPIKKRTKKKSNATGKTEPDCKMRGKQNDREKSVSILKH